MKKKEVVLVGGTFNPVTVAHLKMGQEVRKRFPEAEIVYVPSNMEYIKRWKNLDSIEGFLPHQRKEFLEIALPQLGFLLDTREMDGVLSGKTYDLVMDYKEKGYENVYFCAGYDKIEEIPKWYKAEELLKEAKLLLFNRGNAEVSLPTFYKEKADRVVFLKMPESTRDVSSTKVRRAFQRGDAGSVEDDLTEEVFDALSNRFRNGRESYEF